MTLEKTNLFVYGYSDDLIYFYALKGKIIYAIDEVLQKDIEQNPHIYEDEDSYMGKDTESIEWGGTNILETGIAIFTIGDLVKLTALYDNNGCWSFAVGMVKENTYPRWGPVEIDEKAQSELGKKHAEDYGDFDIPSYSMCATINSIPYELSYIKRIK